MIFRTSTNPGCLSSDQVSEIAAKAPTISATYIFCNERLKDMQQASFMTDDDDDFEETVALVTSVQKLLISLPNDHPSRFGILWEFADRLDDAYQASDDVDFALQALERRREAVSLLPDDHPQPLRYTYELAGSHFGLYEITLDESHLASAVDLMQTVIDRYKEEEGLPTFIHAKTQYAAWCELKHDTNDDIHDIDRALTAYEDIASLYPADSPNQTRCLWMIAAALSKRNASNPSEVIQRRALQLLEKSAHVSTAPPLHLLHASVIWADEAMKCDVDASTTLNAFSRAFELYSLVIWYGYGIRTRQELLGGLVHLNVPSRAADCAIRAHRCELAVEWLDAGRSITWNQLLRLRTPVEELRAVRPDLATRLEEAGKLLESGTDDFRRSTFADSMEGQLEEIAQALQAKRTNHQLVGEAQQSAVRRWEELLQEIRSVPLFERFLLSRTYEDLRHAATFGPVVLLSMTKAGGSALIIRSPSAGVCHVPLPALMTAAAQQLNESLLEIINSAGGRDVRDDRFLVHKRRRPRREQDTEVQFASILQSLWMNIVDPVIKVLGLKKQQDAHPSDLPRIWWCPSGSLMHLPIHAAGLYGRPDDEDVCLGDFAISSYAPILSMIVPTASSHIASLASIVTDPRILAVGQTDAAGLSLLPGTVEELQRIVDIAGESIVRRLEGEQATVEAVVSSLSCARLLHFACHGEQSPLNGFYSAIHLRDGRLDLTRLIRERLPEAQFAFLSACQTARGDKENPDEVAHVAGALLFAGCKGVVGTQWSIEDADGPDIAGEFYSYLFRRGPVVDIKEAAVALHVAVQALRVSGVSFWRWVPFVHFGI